MNDKINVKKFLVVWGIAICARFILYMYALTAPINFYENYNSIKYIDPVASIVIIIVNLIALQKCVNIVDEICPGDKKTPNAFILILALGFTLGVLDWCVLKGQLERMESKCRVYKRSVDTQKVKNLFIAWYIFSLIQIYYQRVNGIDIGTVEDYQSYCGGVITLCAIVWALFVCFVLKYTGAINDVIEAGNIYRQNEKRQQEEEKRIAEEQRLKREQEEIKKRKEKRIKAELLDKEQQEKEQQKKEQKKKEEHEKEKEKEPLTRIDRSLWHYSLSCLEGEYEGMDIPLEEDEFVMLGRNAGTVNIVFTNASISGLHCQIRYSVNDDCFQVVDFSSYGTFVDDKKLDKGELVNCPVGSIVDLGRTGNRFRLVAERHL